MRKELYELLINLSSMKSPSVRNILRKRGFKYEAGVIETLIKEFEENDKIKYSFFGPSSEIG